MSTLETGGIKIAGVRTSIRLEPEMWTALYDIAKQIGQTVDEVCTSIKRTKPNEASLTSAVRVFILGYYRDGVSDAP